MPHLAVASSSWENYRVPSREKITYLQYLALYCNPAASPSTLLHFVALRDDMEHALKAMDFAMV